jgi:hypothetical protein
MQRQYAIIENDAGLTVAEMKAGESPEQTAERAAGLLVDPGPYKSYQDAYDALVAIEDEDDEDDVAV